VKGRCAAVQNTFSALSFIFKVSYTEGDELASELNVPFVETSALTGDNVEQAFVSMTANIKRFAFN
jgi:hypothetical protein